MTMTNKLNLGCGYVMPDDWVNVDKLDYSGNVVADVLKGLPYPDNHFDLVLMNHTLQMFTYEELPIVLKEVRRVMKDGATLRILTPDIDRAIQAYSENDHKYFPINDDLEETTGGKFTRYLFWHGDTRCAFNENSLSFLLIDSDFVAPIERPFGECELDSRKSESLIVECKK